MDAIAPTAISASLAGDYPDLIAFAARLRDVLTDRELRRLMWVSWIALGDAAAEDVARIITDGAGYPLPGLSDQFVMGSARIWADAATRRELKAYGAAIAEKMSAADRAAFTRYLDRRAAA